MTDATFAASGATASAGGESFEDLAWLFRCDSRNRGIIAQGFDEAAMLWKATRATAGDILEIGRKRAGSTVLLAAASPGRLIYSLDLRLRQHMHRGEWNSKDFRIFGVKLRRFLGDRGIAAQNRQCLLLPLQLLHHLGFEIGPARDVEDFEQRQQCRVMLEGLLLIGEEVYPLVQGLHAQEGANALV